MVEDELKEIIVGVPKKALGRRGTVGAARIIVVKDGQDLQG